MSLSFSAVSSELSLLGNAISSLPKFRFDSIYVSSIGSGMVAHSNSHKVPGTPPIIDAIGTKISDR